MKIIDLTQTIESGMQVYTGDPKVEIETVQSGGAEGWRLQKLTLGSHTGSHVDAPYHMAEAGATLDTLPLERFFGDAVIASTDTEFPKHVGLVFRDEQLGEDLLPRFILAGTPFVVVGDKAHMELALERQLLSRDILTFTDLINLSELPSEKHFAFYGIPLKIKNSDGSPIRAFAIVD